MILRFLHGWGFDASFWRPLIAELGEWTTECDDRGYFGAPADLAAGPPSIIVAHSFGAMRALFRGDAVGLIAINGFDRFTADRDFPGVSPRILDRMIARFDEAPATVLNDFRRAMGSERASEPIAADTLRQDLQSLRSDDCRGMTGNLPIMSLQGAGDRLLPVAMRDGVFADAERRTHADGAHLLPLTHPAWCAAAIRAFAERLQ